MIFCGEVISESELLIYVKSKCKEKKERRHRCAPENCNSKPFTIVWFDEIKKESMMCLTNAFDCVEALSKTADSYPILSNVTAYPLHLPATLKFRPDN